jgi:hypothetical protein
MKHHNNGGLGGDCLLEIERLVGGLLCSDDFHILNFGDIKPPRKTIGPNQVGKFIVLFFSFLQNLAISNHRENHCQIQVSPLIVLDFHTLKSSDIKELSRIYPPQHQ